MQPKIDQLSSSNQEVEHSIFFQRWLGFCRGFAWFEIIYSLQLIFRRFHTLQGIIDSTCISHLEELAASRRSSRQVKKIHF